MCWVSLVKKPARAVATTGVYNFAFSIQPLGNGASEVRYYLIKTDTSYFFGGTSIDNHVPLTTEKFNAVCFAVNNNNPNVRAMHLRDVKVDLGEPITIPEAPFSAYYVDQWGYIGSRIGGWSFTPGNVIGNASTSGSGPLGGNYSALRGGFIEPIAPTVDKALIVTGQMEFVGAGFDTWSSLRYGVFFSDSAGSIIRDTTPANGDSTRWSGKEANHYGYLFTPYSGTNDPVSWQGIGRNGTHGGVVNRPWISTNGANDYVLGEFRQKPARAVATAGVYDFAFSIQPLGNGSSEVRFYLIKEDTSYFFGGSSIDNHVPLTTEKFNAVCFAVNNNNPNVRAMHLRDIRVDLGDPIIVPEAPFEAYYVDQWGFIGGRIGGWSFTPGDVIGNATISGNAPNTGWSALRAGFVEPITPTTQKALVVTGQMEFVGGGFEAWSSLRYGAFFSDSAGRIIRDTTPADGDSTRWSGTENRHSGYLFLSQSGSNGLVSWQGIGQNGSWGAVVDDAWISTNGASNYVLGTQLHQPSNAVAGAGVYDFALSIAPQGNGTSEVRFKLIKTDKSYSFYGQAIDSHNPLVTDKFNSVAFALNANASTTAMTLFDVKIDLGDPIDLPTKVEEPAEAEIPTKFVLNQNFPNPFNPTTAIEFGIPRNSEVKLVIYDLAGRVVKKLAAGKFNAGYHRVDFDATNLVSGIYYYRLEAGDFVSGKKLMLLK